MDERQLHQRMRGVRRDARFKVVARWIITVDGGRGAIKKRMA
jgi:hypothetical protein